MLDIFYKDKSQYNNQLDPVKGYLEQLTKYISIKKSIPQEEAELKAKEIIKQFFRNKSIKYFEREANGDRVVKDGTLLSYISNNIKEKNILVPTFTSYVNTSVDKSILSEFIFENIKKRSIAKKIGQKAKAEGNMELADAKNNEQNMMKIYNNSLSGAFAQEACILYNPTAHSTLTSITRTITSLSNASNEKLISGNRYYPRGNDILNNIIYIVTYADIDKIKQVIDKYNLYIPTIKDTVNVLKYSSDLYFIDNNFYINKIIPFLEKLNGYQLAAICYIGDLYHLRKYNDIFIRNLLDELIIPINTTETDKSVIDNLYKVNENILNFVHHIFYSTVKGYGKDYEKMHNIGFANSLYATCKHIEEILNKYKDFWNSFFMTDILPGNSFRLKTMRRRTVVLSDTDSTCFTVDEWIKWYKGEFFIDDKSIALTGCIAYIAAQSIINQLAILSKYMNIEQEQLNTLAMKNEYLWKSFVPSEVSKHYFASTAIQEGNVFKEDDIEIKGVHLKNSAVPKFIIQDAKNIMKYILNSISTNEKIKLNDIINKIKTLENNIKESISKGESVYFKRSKIKSKEAYSQDQYKSPYQRHIFWKEVFAPKYGDIQNPPYDVIKLPTIINSTVELTKWISSIEDEDLKVRLVNWLKTYNKKDLPTIYLNDVFVLSYGIPKEIMDIIDIKRIILDITIQHRIILETLGVMLYDDKLISEQFL